MNHVFIGYDPRQAISYTTLHYSIVKNSSEPVAITPLIIEQLPMKRTGLTPFTYSRFIVPHLCGFRGLALFLDADMLMLGDVSELFRLGDGAVAVSKNKLRFEWASVMLFDCGHRDNGVLTPEFIDATDRNLHKIEWTDSVGGLPPEWNHLVGYDPPRADPKLIHYTQGVPAWPETEDCEHTEIWRQYVKEATDAKSWVEIMGRSVHAAPVVERLKASGKIDQMPWTVA